MFNNNDKTARRQLFVSEEKHESFCFKKKKKRQTGNGAVLEFKENKRCFLGSPQKRKEFKETVFFWRIQRNGFFCSAVFFCCFYLARPRKEFKEKKRKEKKWVILFCCFLLLLFFALKNSMVFFWRIQRNGVLLKNSKKSC